MTIEEQAKIRANEQGVTCYWFPHDEEVRLLFVDDGAISWASDNYEIMPFYFDSTEDLTHPCVEAEVNVQEIDKVKFPSHWGTWKNAVKIDGEKSCLSRDTTNKNPNDCMEESMTNAQMLLKIAEDIDRLTTERDQAIERANSLEAKLKEARINSLDAQLEETNQEAKEYREELLLNTWRNGDLRFLCPECDCDCYVYQIDGSYSVGCVNCNYVAGRFPTPTYSGGRFSAITDAVDTHFDMCRRTREATWKGHTCVKREGKDDQSERID